MPNPFADETTISYSLPNDGKKAQVIFYDLLGNVIKAVELTSNGDGSLRVFGSDLSNGIYTYSILQDGKVVDSKKMVKVK